MSEQTGFRCERLERGFRPGAVMRDHLGCGEAAEPAGRGQVAAMGEPEEEARGVEIAGAGGIAFASFLVTMTEPFSLRVSAAISQWPRTDANAASKLLVS